jgi:glycosyltransferase involved in cell wall biosynthesis
MKNIFYFYKKQKKINSINLHSRNIIGILKEQLLCSITETSDVGVANSLNADDDVFFIPFGGFDYRLFKIRKFSSVVLVFHNITPPKHFLWDDIPMAIFALLGYIQLYFLSKTKARWITVSEFNASLLKKYNVDAKVCPSIVEIPPSSIHECSKSEEPSVIYVGRIVQNKQCFELLDIVCKASEQLKQKAIFYIVGNGKARSSYFKEYINKIRKLENHPYLKVEWKEGLNYNDLTKLYAQCWLYVTMSKHEGFGVPVCESVACGTPGLYTPCGGQETILNNCGVVNAEDFSNQIVRYIKSADERSTLLSQQKKYVDTYMSPIIDNKVKEVFGNFCK